MKISCRFGGSPQSWTGFRGHSYALYGISLRPRYRMVTIVGGCNNFKYFCDMPDIFVGKQ